MAIDGWYYLHINGDLIYKRELGGTAADIRESDFARALWPFDPCDRETMWRLLVEMQAAGGNMKRIQELSAKWGANDDDAQVYASRVGCNLFMDGNVWCATGGNFVNIQESHCGFGDTCLDAMAELAIALGFRPSKMWGATFHDLLNQERDVSQTG